MSATTKKKHVTKEVLEEYPLPEGGRQVVRVTAARGNNLHEVETANKETFLVSMPTKFRKHVWIKRGDYILVEPIEEGGKVKAEISHILFREQIKHIKDKGLWPEAFLDKPAQQDESMISSDLLPPSESEDSDEDLADLVINLNRVAVPDNTDSEDDDSDDEEEEEESESNEISHVAETTSAPKAVSRLGVAIQSENAT
ncbi:unnamed protein product [Candidula unifasciata]|uniref:Probable RNA-binding protein EIF1AD n=1 Tax=Candidula unifasciata TaxID=100452 RepID=A0A8S3Z8U7_9EUPU|nr:unnamed protein product [Candidula unifasciata]